ncbi:hypothetical protein [Helicobacter saguini]|uniref:hypothetical protein n=1 Tax=Helicobacter saguini TaxID=1548018 RepID=UPI0007EA1DE5|nr:hypothetical protein [Helicobacter saguini]
MSEEVNYKVKFANKYFDNGESCEYDINNIDVIVRNKLNKPVLYIESKYQILDKNAYRKALAQIILTNKKQKDILDKVALIYLDSNNDDILELISCDDSVMFNNDINWNAETPSTPSKDAIDRINDRLAPKTILKDGKKVKIPRISVYKNDEIKQIYKSLMQGQSQIHITTDNAILVYNEWKNNVEFVEPVLNEQDLINLFLVDMLDGTKYKKEIKEGSAAQGEVDSIEREGTQLNNYDYSYDKQGNVEAIKYTTNTKYTNSENSKVEFYPIKNMQDYNNFWAKYVRPPTKQEFLKILEYSARFYSDNYRRNTGGEYTPSCFVELQNKILKKHYNLNEFLVFDPCAGVGNLENDFGKEYKESCYLSTLEQIDVDTCLIKGFDNVVRFDYLKDSKEPLFMHGGQNTYRTISEICKKENKKLMVIMNPPYQNKKDSKHNTAIQFFNKVIEKTKPQVIVFYYMTESFLRDEIESYIKSGYKIVSHCFSNAKTTFGLSEWSISQIIFDKDNGKEINKDSFSASRYEPDSKDLEIAKLHFVKKYRYDLKKPCLIDEIQKAIKEHQKGMILGDYSYLAGCINLTNKTNTNSYITALNLKYCLLSRGLIFNDHNKYFERNKYIFKGKMNKISNELFGDAVMFALFFKNCAFSNKYIIDSDGNKVKLKNYIMPFTHEELGCPRNALNVLYPDEAAFVDNVFHDTKEKPFDFRIFLKQFEFSKEAKDLYKVALEVFRFYHKNKEYENKDFNDSYYDITNAIMQRDPLSFKVTEYRQYKLIHTKSTKGSKGFGRNTIKYVVNSKYHDIFNHFFDTRDNLARKINKQLLESNLLLWERENLY